MSFFDGKTVLVTGAGGTIGSEICRQLLKNHNPSALLLVDNSEIALYQIERELAGRYAKSSIMPLLVDVSCGYELWNLPDGVDVVYHAAAYKHVRMCELNPGAAWRVNSDGTRHLLSWAERTKVPKFLLISTDKAVKPTTVMGLTKKHAELLVRQAGYTVVRLGNVACSSGSVIPLWQEQIAAGKPVTITDGRATRYFQTSEYVAKALLTAAQLDARGETLVVDMGQPVGIFSLAQSLGATKFDFIGLQPGEKVHEDLFAGKRELVPGYNLYRDVA